MRTIAYYEAMTQDDGRDFEPSSVAPVSAVTQRGFWLPIVSRVLALLGALGGRRG